MKKYDEQMGPIPPQNIEAEKAILGGIIIDHMAIHRVASKLTSRDFYVTKHGIIYQSMLDVALKGQKADVLEVSSDLESKGVLTQVGGRSYLVEVSNTIATASHIEHWVDIVLDKSIRRQILFAQHQNEGTIYKEDWDINTVLAEVQSNIFKINPLRNQSDKAPDIVEDLSDLQEEYSKKYESGKAYIGIPTSFKKIDEVIDGLRPGHLWVIGAWHGTGKTSFALNIMNHVLVQKIPCSIISLEMSQVDIAAKLMGIRLQISSAKIIRGVHTPQETWDIGSAKDFIRKSPLEIHTEFDLEKIKMQIRRDVYVNKVRVVMIDYLQKITSEKIMEETPLMSKAAKDFSNLAQELKITIIALSQISNETQKGQGAGAGFKGSGAIEASADMAIRLKRDRTKEDPTSEYVEVQILITKNKFGWDGASTSMMHLLSGHFTPEPV